MSEFCSQKRVKMRYWAMVISLVRLRVSCKAGSSSRRDSRRGHLRGYKCSRGVHSRSSVVPGTRC